MDNITWIGIDPGNKGGVGAIWPGGHGECWKTPVVPTIVKKKRRITLNVPGMHAIIKDIYARSERCYATVEKVQAMQKQVKKRGKVVVAGQGISSAFTFGKGTGIWIGLIVGLDIPYTETHPLTWKKTAFPDMSKGKKSKGAAVLRAQQLFPNISDKIIGEHQGKVVYYDGPAEAILIARHGTIAEGGLLCSTGS